MGSTFKKLLEQDQYFNKRQSILYPLSPGVTDDIFYRLKKALWRDWGKIQDNAYSFTRHLLRIVRLVPRDGNHQHGNSMTQALEEAVWASVSDKRSHSRMC